MKLPLLELNSNEKVDLHIHSIYSDGIYSPIELAKLAHQKSLRIIALTDHATVTGISEIIFAAAKMGIYAIPGIEINSNSSDFLGYFFDYQDKEFLSFLEKLQLADIERITAIINLLNKGGFKIDEYELFKFAEPAIPRRSHIARFLVEKKYFSSIDEAFKNVLSKKSPYYVPSLAPPAQECLQAIKKAGGIAILAHPYFEFYDQSGKAMAEKVKMLCKEGLVGYEFSPGLKQDYQLIQAEFEKLAVQYNLIRVEGSNFHGPELSPFDMGEFNTNIATVIKLQSMLPDYSLHKNYLNRMYWRAFNLSENEFKNSLHPEEIILKNLHFKDLLQRAEPVKDIPADFKGCPFILVRGIALNKLETIRKIIAKLNFVVIDEVEQHNYREIAWDLYDSASGSYINKMRDLLKFNLDYLIENQDSNRCIIIFLEPVATGKFRYLKKELRKSIGEIKFYRVYYQDVKDIHFTSFIHIPDNENINQESWRLHKLGINIPRH